MLSNLLLLHKLKVGLHLFLRFYGYLLSQLPQSFMPGGASVSLELPVLSVTLKSGNHLSSKEITLSLSF